MTERILKLPPMSAASGRTLQSWKAAPTRSLERLRYVTQIVKLLYRRLLIGRTSAELTGSGQGAVLQDGILRYSRLPVCATNPAKALNTYSLERLRYVAHAFQRAGSGGFPAARWWYFQDAPGAGRPEVVVDSG